MKQQCLAEALQRVGSRVQHLVLDDPSGEVAGPLFLAEGKVQLTRPPTSSLLDALDVLNCHLQYFSFVQLLVALRKWLCCQWMAGS